MGCKVCKVKGVQSEIKLKNNDKLILQNLYQNREGLRVITLMKLTNLKKRNIYKRLNILREKGLIENIFPVWKIPYGRVNFCSKLLRSDNIFELHNIGCVVKLIKIPDWWSRRKNYLIRLKEFQFKKVDWGKKNSNPYIQLINENWVIQTYPESLIIISRKRYYSDNPYELSINFLKDIYDLLDWFEERFRFKFFLEGIPHIELRSNDFNRLNDYIANKVKDLKTKFLVQIDKRRKVWVDLSEPFGKEANYPEGQEILEKVTKDHLLNKPMLNSELQLVVSQTAKQIQQVTNNQLLDARNIIKHQKVLDEMLITMKLIQKNINRKD